MPLPEGVPPIDRVPIDQLLDRLPLDSPLRESLLLQTSFEPVTGEFRVNVADPDAEQGVDIAQLANGNAIIIWNDYPGEVPAGDGQIHGRLIDAEGNLIGGELVLTSGTPVDFFNFSIAPLEGGGFVIVWATETPEPGGSGTAVMARIFASDGTPLTGEFQVNTQELGNQNFPDVAGLEGGGFVVTWSNDSLDFTEFGVQAQIFNADGSRVGGEIDVNSTPTNFATLPRVAGLESGGFVITWTDLTSDFSDSEIRAQVFSAGGEPTSAELTVNIDDVHLQQRSDVAGTADGGFVVVWWHTDDTTFAHSIRGRQFDSQNLAVGEEFLISAEGSTDARAPYVEALNLGGFVVSWAEGAEEEDAFARAFIDWDSPWTDPMLVNTETEGRHVDAETAPLGDGFIVAWLDAQALLVGEVEARVYDLLI